ncbi:hypothetical protein Bca101_002629 [Brassica carinata]
MQTKNSTKAFIEYLLNSKTLFFCCPDSSCFPHDEFQTTPPAPQDEMRAALSYFHETTWKEVTKFLRRVATALKNIGNLELMSMFLTIHLSFRSLLGRVLNPRNTRDVCLLGL